MNRGPAEGSPSRVAAESAWGKNAKQALQCNRYILRKDSQAKEIVRQYVAIFLSFFGQVAPKWLEARSCSSSRNDEDKIVSPDAF